MVESSNVWSWKENNPNIIARIIPKNQILQESKGWNIFGVNVGFKQAIVGPGEVALFIKNGKVVDTVSQDKMEGLSGGFLNMLGNHFGGGDDFIILFASLEQIDYLLPIGGEGDDQCPMTQDNYPMRGSAIFEFQVDPNNAVKIIPLMRTSGILLKTALVNRINFEASVSVFSNLVAKYNAADFKGNMEIVHNLENVAQIEMQKTFSTYGIMLTQLITKWERNDFDAALIERQKVDTEFMIAEKNHEDWMKRSGLKHEQVMQAIDFQFHEEAETIKAEQRKITLEMQEKLAQLDIEQQAKDTVVDKELGRQDKIHGQTVKHGYEDAQADDYKSKLEIERDKMEMQNMMEIKKQMAETRAQEYQATQLESQKVDADTEKHKATMDAEKQKYNLDTYRTALSDERDHQVNMMGAMANLTQAAKQNVPHTLVQGNQGGGGGNPNAQVRIVEGNVQTNQGVPQAPAQAGGGKICTNCGGSISAGQKFCPGCGTPAPAGGGGASKFCGNCGGKIEAGQKFCPGCGTQA